MKSEFIEREFEVYSEFAKHILTISNKNDILHISIKNVHNGLLFEDAYSLERLVKLENYFTNFSTIESVTKALCELSQEKKIELSTGEKIMILKFIKPYKNISELKMEIPYIEYPFNDEPNAMVTRREKEMILKWINPEKELELKLIYKASIDGDTPAIFHHKVNGIKKTVTIILTDKGFRCGGFISNEWKTNCDYDKNDKNSFLFSIEKKENYYNKDGFCNYNHPNFGPCFGKGFDLCIGENVSNFFTTNKHYSEFPSSYGDKGKSIKYALTGGFKNFNVKDIEIYQVIAVDE